MVLIKRGTHATFSTVASPTSLWWMSLAAVSYTSLTVKGFLVLALWFSSVQFSRSVMSDSLRPHESQHARPSCPSPTPRVHSDSHPSSQWCHPAMSSSVVPFCSWPQSLPASASSPMSQLFTWGGLTPNLYIALIGWSLACALLWFSDSCTLCWVAMS